MARVLEGKVIIVTGAAGGIGSATSLVLADAGAKVVVTDIVDEGALAVVDAIKSGGGVAAYIRADLAAETEVAGLIQKTIAMYGRLDGAFNNAAVEQSGKPLHELTTAQWERALRVDLTAVFWCMKYQILAMLKHPGGAIVNTASSLGQVAIQNASEYITAKHGILGVTRAAAAEYGIHGVRINAVLPGIIKTPMIARLELDPTFADLFGKLKGRHPIGRFGNPAEIGEAVKWLLSDSASFVNGTTMAVDGGYLAI